MRDAAADGGSRKLWFRMNPHFAMLAPDRLGGKATPAGGPADRGLKVSRRSPVPGLWGILTAPL